MALPQQKDARKPITRPKQWKSGGGQHTTSSGPWAIARQINRPLLIRFLRKQASAHWAMWRAAITYVCVNMAALGVPVVPSGAGQCSNRRLFGECHIPEVNCRFAMSSGTTQSSAVFRVGSFSGTERVLGAKAE